MTAVIVGMAAPSAFGELYYNNEYSFSVQYPDEWRVIDGDVLDEGVSFMDGSIECTKFLISPFDCLWNTNVVLYLAPDVGEQLSDSEERDWQIKGQRDACDALTYVNFGDATCKNFKIIKKFPSTTVDGYRIITTQFSMIKDYPDDFSANGPMIQLTSYIYDGNDIWVISSESDKDVFDEHEKLLWNMIKSFKLPAIDPLGERWINPMIESNQIQEIEKNMCGDGTVYQNGRCEVIKTTTNSSEGGGCLIATATYGSELAPQVQQLRELRNNQLLNTESGTAFMGTFNDFYYSFSPIIADYERENPLFKEAVKLAITPMLSSLSLMESANSESEVLGIGLSVIALNLGMYLAVPAVLIVGIKKKF
jgi:hypothetical protein